MPICHSEKIRPGTQLMVWHLTESMDILKIMAMLDLEEEEQLRSFGNVTRKLHWLGYRVLLNALFSPEKVKVTYDKNGKPKIDLENTHLSVSHSGDYAAVIIDQNDPVGIDIEKIKDRIERVKERFLSDMELLAIGGENRLEKLHVCWGAKESLYKVYGSPDIDLLSDIHLKHFDYLRGGIGSFRALLKLPERDEYFTVGYRKLSDYMLVWTIKEE